MTAVSAPRIDDVTFEVMRHRLWEINHEIGVLAARMSASPAVYETGDYNTGILTADGKGMFSGVGVIRMATALDLVVQSVRELFGADVNAGDVFLTNDPYAGALHAMDVAVVAPVFAEGRVVSWTGIVFHELDMGGPTPGSWSVGASDAYQEPPLISPVKVVDRGAVRPDIEALFLRNSRVPHILGVNLHAKMGAQSLSQARIGQLISEIGVEAYLHLQQRILDDVTQAVRSELARIPDGEWRVSTYLDHDGVTDAVYELVLTAKKTGEHLTLDFTGTSPQAPGPINCARSGLVAGVLEVLVPAFCVDAPWAHGAVADCVEIISEPGTINNATYPAPTSMATVNACQSTSDLVWQALSRMRGWVPDRTQETIALGYGGVNTGILSGSFAATKRPFVLAVTGLGGGGGRCGGDGVDSGGNIIAPIFAIPNVERLESLAPVLYLWRRELPDSAGAGQWRGGLGLEYAIAAHRAQNPLTGIAFCTSWAAPATRGALGGLPGGLQSNLLIDDVDPIALLSGDDLFLHEAEGPDSEATVLPGKARFALGDSQLWISTGSGGGGFGDPVLRDLHAVAADVREGKCTPAHAASTYGVVLRQGEPDLEATEHARRRIRSERLAGQPPADTPAPSQEVRYRHRNIYYDHVDGHQYLCHNCNAVFEFGTSSDASALRRTSLSLAAVNPANRWCGDYGFTLVTSACPHCGQLHAVDVVRAGSALPSGATEVLGS